MSEYQSNSSSISGSNAGAPWVAGLNAMREAQKAFIGEAMLSANEAMDRFRIESHLLNEFLSKMAGAHSVKDLATMWEECGRHQIEFARRESERFFGHSARLLNTTTTLLKTPLPGKQQLE